MRFTETERYDVLSDQQVVRLMCITDTGTYHIEVPADDGLRQRRAEFKQMVLQSIDAGIPPCELELEDEDG